MVIPTTIVDLERDGTLKLPRHIARQFRAQKQLSITRVGTSLVLAPIPTRWTRAAGRVVKYQNGLIVRDPKIMFGTPVIHGTRIPARVIAGYAAAKYSHDQIRNEFPFLSDAQIDAAIRFIKSQRAKR